MSREHSLRFGPSKDGAHGRADITLHEKGDRHRRIGLHFNAVHAIGEYINLR